MPDFRSTRTATLRLFAPFVVAGTAAACTSSTAPDRGRDVPLAVRVADTAFTRDASASAEIGFTVTNVGPRTLTVTPCGPALNPVIERLQAGAWRQYSGGHCIAINPMAPVPLAPGTERTGLTSIAEPGRYRLVVFAEGEQRAASDAFTVR